MMTEEILTNQASRSYFVPENDKNRNIQNMNITANSPQPPSTQLKTIYNKADSKGEIIISESFDKSKAYIHIDSTSSTEKYSSEDLHNIFIELGITTGIKAKEIEVTLLQLNKEGGVAEDILIADGQAPLNGKDGVCEILYNREDPYVQKDQILIRISEPTSGKEGNNIYGSPIKAVPGKMPKVTAGGNVIAKGAEFYSNIFGRASFENDILAVYNLIEVKVSKDKMEASITYTGSTVPSRETIIGELHAKNIIYGIDDHSVDLLISSFESEGKQINSFPVAHATPCKKGRDGKITYLFGEDKEPRYKEKEDGSIDIREINIVQNVKEGSEIATIVPPIEPIPGKDVYGKVITPPTKPTKASLKAGKNIKVSDDGLHFFAESSGRPILDRGKISVDEVFCVQGDLNLAVGNIDFDGVVEIGGDVVDGFQVKASKTIIVHGIVGACDLEAGLDIQILGGCNGKENSNLICGRDIEARYINEVNIKARGNVTAKNEIVNSNVLALGRVSVNSGSIRGGEIIAKKGIDAYDFGSDMGVKTILFPGEDFELNEKCKKIDECIIVKNKEITEINKLIAPLIKNKELLPKLPQEQRNKLIGTINHLKSLGEEKDALNQNKNKLISETLADSNPEVVVYHNIFHGALLKIGKSRREISSKLEGPLRLYQSDETVSVEPYSKKKENKKKPSDEKNV